MAVWLTRWMDRNESGGHNTTPDRGRVKNCDSFSSCQSTLVQICQSFSLVFCVHSTVKIAARVKAAMSTRHSMRRPNGRLHKAHTQRIIGSRLTHEHNACGYKAICFPWKRRISGYAAGLQRNVSQRSTQRACN